MPLRAPIRYRPDLETIDADEVETVSALNEAFDTILERTAQDYGRGVRAVHAKAHAVMAGELVVDDGLAPELRQGLFAAPERHPVWMRLSTNAGDLLPDSIGLPRGMAIKVLDVGGERLTGAEGTAQDFVLVNANVFQAKSADKFLGNLKMLAATTDRVEGVKKVVSTALRGVDAALTTVGVESSAVRSLGGAANVDPLGETYYSAVPFRYGDAIAKFSVAPLASAQTALTGRIVETGGRDDAIREDVRGEMRDLDAVWEFRVQLCRDLERQPIEDPTVAWDEADAPFQRVATITIPAQDSWDPAQVLRVDEAMRFSVWTGLEAHRPLGNINRARRDTYLHSAGFRARVNGCPVREPTDAEAG